MKRFTLDGSVLSIFQLAVSNGLLSDSQLEVAREIAGRSLYSDDCERRIAAIHFYIAYIVGGKYRYVLQALFLSC